MKYGIPESSFVSPPHKVENAMNEAKKSFYELAKEHIRYFNHEQFMDWVKEIVGEDAEEYADVCVLHVIKSEVVAGGNEEVEKYVTNLDIAVDTTKFNIDDKDYSDIIPFTIEHEIYEAWLRTKKGFMEEKEFSEESRERAHLLALRKEFLLAEEQGKAEKVFEWRMKVYPESEEEYLEAWEGAKKKLHRKEGGDK